MNDCDFNQKLDAYHDGELSGDELAAFEAHLTTCGACSAQLAQLQAVSNLLASAPQPKLSQIAMHRLHHRIDSAMDQGLLRLGWAMSAIAASLLLVASVWLTRVGDARPMTASAAPPWVGVPVVSQADPAYREIAATPAAEWYLADASTRNDDIP